MKKHLKNNVTRFVILSVLLFSSGSIFFVQYNVPAGNAGATLKFGFKNANRV